MFPYISINKPCDSGTGPEQSLGRKFAKYIQGSVATVAVGDSFVIAFIVVFIFVWS